MFRVEKTLMREERYRHKRDNPSFSSSLLDQICRSIDDNDGISDTKNQGLKFNSKKQEIWDPQRDCLIEKWMENKVSEKKIAGKKQGLKDFKKKSHHHHHHHVSLFSSSSSSSDSSSGGFFSSSDTESLYGSKTKAPCFVPPPSLPKPKPVRTSVSAPPEKLDERSKSRAMKIYGSLKKVKQPISPGARLASFINSLFTNSKKTKNPDDDDGGGDDEYDERKLKSSQVCSSASSFSRSCLSKNTREKSRNGVKRTVRFCPVSVIVDEDSRPCGQKRVYEQQKSRLLPVSVPTAWKIGKSSSEVKFQVMEKSKRVEEMAREIIREYHQNQKKNSHYDDDDDDDDAGSESSSDLFELDHLVLMGNDRYKEELPVYETTHVETNRAIANGFIM